MTVHLSQARRADRHRDGVLTIALAGLTAALLATLVLFAVLPTSAGAETCPNEQYRTGPSANLPDCRAYELVTPPYKNTGKLYFTGIGDEGAVTFTSITGFGGAEAGEGLPGFVYVAGRGAEGWETSSVTPPTTGYLDLEAEKLTGSTGPVADQSADRRTTLWVLHGLSQADNAAGFYLTAPGAAPVELGPALPPNAAPVVHQTQYAGAPVEVEGLSADAGRVLFRLREEGGAAGEWSLGRSGAGGPGSLLEYAGTCGGPGECAAREPLPVGVENDGSPVDGCTSQILGGKLRSQVIANENDTWTHNAMSSEGAGTSDGQVVFLTDTCTEPGKHQLYARIDNGEVGAETVAVSEPTKADCATCETFAGEPAKRSPAYFLGASRDGSRVFWTTEQPLLDGSSEENIYEYNFESDVPPGQRVTRVSGGDATVSDPSVELQGVVQVAEDGSHVYFVAKGVLTSNPNGAGQKALTNADDLYVFDTETDTTAFVATLLPGDSELWRGTNVAGFPRASDLTPAGRFLVFASHAHLTPGDTSTAPQLFEYDAQTGALVRVSIGEEGYNENGNALLLPSESPEFLQSHRGVNPINPDYEAPYSAAAYSSRLAVSGEGAYVFFQSSDALTPQALDYLRIYPSGGAGAEKREGDVFYAENVYEYHAGRVYLISDGQDVSAGPSSSSVNLLGTDSSGRDVFFTTTDSLVGQDTDTNEDLYDARVEGGFPAPAAPPECEGDACQGALSAAPTLLSPGSEFQAAGNPLPAPAPVAVAKSKAKVTLKCNKPKKPTRGKCLKPKQKKAKTSAHKSTKARN